MSSFTFLDDSAWNSYSDLAGGTILTRSATALTYQTATGYTVTLQGTRFAYGADGVPVGGVITRLDVYLDAAHLAEYRGLHTTLDVYARLGLGQVSGSATVLPTDMTALYTRLRSLNDIITGSDFGRNYDGFAGNDAFYGGAGDDWFFGGRGIDSYQGGGGVDGISFLPGAITGVRYSEGSSFTSITIDGTNSSDVGVGGIELLETTDFDDTVSLYMFGTMQTVWLMGGNDRIEFRSLFADSRVYGGTGNDTISGGNVVDGGDGIDQLSGTHIAFWSADEGGHGAIVDLTLASGQIVDDGFGNTETTRTTSFYGTRFGDRMTSAANGGDLWAMRAATACSAGRGATACTVAPGTTRSPAAAGATV